MIHAVTTYQIGPLMLAPADSKAGSTDVKFGPPHSDELVRVALEDLVEASAAVADVRLLLTRTLHHKVAVLPTLLFGENLRLEMLTPGDDSVMVRGQGTNAQYMKILDLLDFLTSIHFYKGQIKPVRQLKMRGVE